MITIQEINRYEEWARIKAEWNCLVSLSESGSFFSTFEWLAAWWRHFGKGRELFILVLREENRIIGLAPWMISPAGRKGFSFKKIEFIGAGLSDWAGLILPEGGGDRALDLIADHLNRRSDLWDVATFSELKEGKLSEAFGGVLGRRRWTLQRGADSVCPLIRLEGTWEDFYNANTTPKTRSYRRRDLRRLEKHGTLQFKLLEDLSNEPRIAERIFDLGREVCPDVFASPERAAFLQELLTLLSRSGRLKISLLELDKQVISFLIGFIYDGQYLAYLTGYNREYSYGSPGEATLQHALEHCFESGIRQFHFLRGPEAYKFKWASDFQNNIRIELFRGFKGSLVYRYRRIKALRKA